MSVAAGLFAKPPVPGRVKTRLCPPLSPNRAAALYRAFLVDTAALCTRDPSRTFDVFSPDPEQQEAAWPSEASRPAHFRPQRGAHLGERLHRAFTDLFAEGHQRALILGSDHPTLPASRLADALDKLRWADVVLGPSLDGGYYLVGMAQAPPADLLNDIPWSTPHVLRATQERIEAAGLRCSLLRPWYDVDTPRDLERLARDLEWGAERSAAARALAATRETGA